MSPIRSHSSKLADLVDLVVRLRQDADENELALHRRDRQIAQQLEGKPHSVRREVLLRFWLDRVWGGSVARPGRWVQTTYRTLLLVLSLLGLGCGWGVALGVFHYDGSRPVNVVHVLAVFVVAQFLLLLALGLVMLPRSWVRRLPGIESLQEILSWLSPGQLIHFIQRRFPRAHAGKYGESLSGSGPVLTALARVRKWAVVCAAQVFAVAFNLAALAVCLYLVTFSDLAFSWSTTLEPDVERAHRVTQGLSSPWQSLLPTAVPSTDLLRQTLYYRQSGAITPDASLDPGTTEAKVSPGRWGHWWPFLVACMVTYGLLPRIVLLGFAGWRFARSIRVEFVRVPGVERVVDRLTTEWVSTQALAPEADAPADAPNPSSDPVSQELREPREICLVNWGGIEIPDDKLKLEVAEPGVYSVVGVFQAGGRHSIDEDAQVVRRMGESEASPGVMVVLKSWEPPMLEVLDFMRDLRSALGPERLIIGLLTGLNESPSLAVPNDADVEQWRRRLRSLKDPALVIRPWQKGGAS